MDDRLRADLEKWFPADPMARIRFMVNHDAAVLHCMIQRWIYEARRDLGLGHRG